MAESIKKVPGLPFWASFDGQIYSKDGKPYKQALSNAGYYRISTRATGKAVMFSVHRLVAMAFLDNPQGLPCVNHIDEDRTNNRADNLEWCTQKYNCNHGSRNEKIAKAQLNRADESRPVILIDGLKETVYPSAMQAQRDLGINNGDIIACCRGRRKSAGGYAWRYA